MSYASNPVARRPTSGACRFLAAVVLGTAVCASVTTGTRAQSTGGHDVAAQLSDVTQIELIPGLSAGTFTLLVHCPSERDYTWFWAREKTLVIDIRNTYMPFRGHALGELAVSGVTAIRASQFMEGPIPVARVEMDVDQDMGVEARWVESGLEILCGPPGPAIPAPTLARRPDQPAPVRPETEPGGPPTEPVTVPTPATAPADSARQVLYARAGRVNPFDPLLKPTENVDFSNTQTRPLPDAERLTLEGISFVEGRPEQCVALVRDTRGLHYHLKQGDRVRYGYVSEVGPDEVVFQLDIYGRKKEVRLKLNELRR